MATIRFPVVPVLIGFLVVSCSGPAEIAREIPRFFPLYGECGFTEGFAPPLPPGLIGDSGHVRYAEGRAFYRNPNHLGVDFPAEEGTPVTAGVTGCLVYYSPDPPRSKLTAVISADTRGEMNVLDGLGAHRTAKRFILIYECIRQTREYESDRRSGRSDTHLKTGDHVAPETVIGWVDRRSRDHDSLQCLHYGVRLQSWIDAYALSGFDALAAEDSNSRATLYYTDPVRLFWPEK